jgi:hypothetical protein
MAIFTAAATFLLAGTFLAGSAIATGALAIGLGFAAQFGLSYAISAIAGNKNQPAAASDSFGIQGTLRAGGAVPRAFPLGWSADPGQLVYANYWGVHDKTPNAYFTQVIKLSDLPGPRLLKVWVNGEPCTIDFDPAREHPYGNPLVEYRKDNEDHLWVKYYDGTQTAADPFLVDAVSSADRPYSTKRVGVGIAYVIVTSLANDTLFTGFPDCLFEFSSIPLYDPSKDSTVGGSGPQRYSDPSTWGGDGDDFPAVQAYNVLRGVRYNGQWVYGLQRSTAATVPIENALAQIAKCRAPIAGENGPEPSYRSGGMISVNTQPANALEAMLTACQGKISEVGGFFKLRVGAPDSPTFSFTDADILSSEPQTFKPFFALADSVNGIQATYPDPVQGWKTPATAPAYRRTDLEAHDGDRRLMANPFFARVPYPAQVQRLQKSAIEEGQRARTHQLVMPPVFWLVENGDVGTWTSQRNGYVNKKFRVDGSVDKDNLDVPLFLTEVDPSDYSWNHGSEFRPVGAGPTNIPRPAAQGVVDWNVEPWKLPDSSGIGRRAAVRITWDGSLPSIVGIKWEVRLAEDESAVTRGNSPPEARDVGSIIVSQSLLPDEDYEVRIQYLPSSPRDMLWSEWRPVTTPNVLLGLAEFDAGVVYQVTQVFDALDARISDFEQRFAKVTSKLGAISWDDKKEVRSQLSLRSEEALAEISHVQEASVNADAAMASDILDLFAGVNSTGSGTVNVTALALSTLDESFAEFSGTVSATLGPAFSSVNTVSQAVATLEGYAAGTWGVSIDVEGNVVGIELANASDGFNFFGVTVDNFFVAFPGVAGGERKLVLDISDVDGEPTIVWRGNMIGDGRLIARMIDAGQIKAVHMDAASITAANAAIDRLAVKSLNIEGNAVTVPKLASQVAPAYCISGTYVDVLTTTLTIPTTGLDDETITVYANAFFKPNWVLGDTSAMSFILEVGGSIVLTWSTTAGTTIAAGPLTGGKDYIVGAGQTSISCTIKVRANGSGTGSPGPATNTVTDTNIFTVACKK